MTARWRREDRPWPSGLSFDRVHVLSVDGEPVAEVREGGIHHYRCLVPGCGDNLGGGSTLARYKKIARAHQDTAHGRGDA